MNKWTERLRNEKGDMLILSLLVSSLFLTFSAGYLGLLAVEGDGTERAHILNQALHVAESGAERAIWEIKYNSSAFSGWTTNEDGSISITDAAITTASGETVGTYDVIVYNPTSSSPTISSSGSVLFKQATMSDAREVEITLSVPSGDSYYYAAFAESNISMDSNSCTDSFDSTEGPYMGPNTNPSPPKPQQTNWDSNGDIGINSTGDSDITIASNGNVNGDAYVGEGGDPDDVISAANNTISGSEGALDAAVTIDSIEGPTGLTDNGSQLYNDDGNNPITSSGQYDDFGIDGNTTVTISGTDIKLYVQGDFTMDSNSDLVITDGSTVEIYVDGSIYLSSNTTVNNATQDPSALKFYGTDDLVDGDEPGIRFHSNTDIYAIVQAKNSTVHMDSNAEIFGAVMADSIVMDSNTCIHYDESLASGGGGASSASMDFWHEK